MILIVQSMTIYCNDRNIQLTERWVVRSMNWTVVFFSTETFLFPALGDWNSTCHIFSSSWRPSLHSAFCAQGASSSQAAKLYLVFITSVAICLVSRSAGVRCVTKTMHDDRTISRTFTGRVFQSCFAKQCRLMQRKATITNTFAACLKRVNLRIWKEFICYRLFLLLPCFNTKTLRVHNQKVII